MGEPRILFVSYGGGHIDIVRRLLPALEAVAPGAARVLALTTAAPAMARWGFAHRRCVDYLPLPGYERAGEIGARLSEGVWEAASGIEHAESCAYLGVSMVDLIAAMGEEAAQQRYVREGRAAFCPQRFIGAMLDQEKPALIVTTCNARMERAANKEARRRGVPSVRIEDLFGFSVLGPYSDSQEPALTAAAEWPDELIVMNDHVARTVIGEGFPAARVHALGQPVLADWAASFASAPVAESLRDWAEQAAPVIAYIAPPDRAVLKAHGAALSDIARRRPDLRFCLKLHPSISAASCLADAGPVPANLRVLDTEDVVTVARAMSLSIVHSSTAGILCAMSGKPMLLLNEIGRPEPLPYVASGAATPVRRLDALEAAIDDALGSVGGGAPKIFMSPPGASGRIASWLLQRVGKTGS